MSDHVACARCGLMTQAEHADERACIAHLRGALLEQRSAAQRMSFDMSMRYLAAIEELALRPGEAGVSFKVRSPDGTIMTVRAEQVSGIFAAILRQFHSLGDWTPLRDAEERADLMGWHAGALLRALEAVIDGGDVSEASSVVTSAREDGVRPPGRGRS